MSNLQHSKSRIVNLLPARRLSAVRLLQPNKFRVVNLLPSGRVSSVRPVQTDKSSLGERDDLSKSELRDGGL